MSKRRNKPAPPNLPRALGGHYTPPFKLVVESSMSGRDHYVKDANGLVVTYQDFERLLNTLTAQLATLTRERDEARAVLRNQERKPRTLYRHYKGSVYELLGACRIEAGNTPAVMYRLVYADGLGRDDPIWVRPRDEFHGALPDGRKRFVHMTDQEVAAFNAARGGKDA